MVVLMAMNSMVEQEFMISQIDEHQYLLWKKQCSSSYPLLPSNHNMNEDVNHNQGTLNNICL